MTNSTDKDSSAPETDQTKKQNTKKNKKKKKGPLRLEAILPVAVLLALLVAYFSYFFDAHVRRGLEWTGTLVHGAEVNIRSLQTSFLKGFLTIRGIQVTDKNQPERNLVQIERIHFQLLWDALLRAKFVVEDASIDNVQAYVPRKKPGYMVPPSKEKNSAMARVQQGVMDQAKEQFEQNVLGDVAHILSGVDPKDQIKSLQADLKSDARLKELDKALKEKQKLWDERLKQLPQTKELNQLVERAKAVKVDTRNLQAAAKGIKELESIYKEADKKVKLIESTSRDLKGDVNTFNQSFKEIEKLAQQDLQDLQSRLKIPNLDIGDFSAKLFGRLFQARVASLKKYMEVGRQYMPPKKSKEEKEAPTELVPRKRGAGRNIQYPITTGYPLFWLKKAQISSEPSASEYSGKISGKIVDVTSDPVYLGRPTVATVKGDFPKQQIYGLDAQVTIDHTTSHPWEKLETFVASYPVASKKLSESKEVQFSLQKASGKAHLTALLKNQELNVKVKNQFQKIQYDIDAKSKMVKEILSNVVAGIPVVTVDMAATGSWSKIRWNISSNLGQELSRGFKKELQAKVNAAKAELKNYIDGRIGAQKAQLQGEFNKVKGQVESLLNQKKGEVEKAQNVAQAEINQKKNQATKGQTKQLEKKGKKVLKDLKKSFGF